MIDAGTATWSLHILRGLVSLEIRRIGVPIVVQRVMTSVYWIHKSVSVCLAVITTHLLWHGSRRKLKPRRTVLPVSHGWYIPSIIKIRLRVSRQRKRLYGGRNPLNSRGKSMRPILKSTFQIPTASLNDFV